MKGSYLIIAEMDANKRYVGSALNGLEQRIQRHLRENKKTHWHIDYLLKHATVTDVFYKEDNVREECIIAKKFEGTLPSILGFGCSDCKCKSHLFYGTHNGIKQVIDRLNMKSYSCDANY